MKFSTTFTIVLVTFTAMSLDHGVHTNDNTLVNDHRLRREAQPGLDASEARRSGFIIQPIIGSAITLGRAPRTLDSQPVVDHSGAANTEARGFGPQTIIDAVVGRSADSQPVIDHSGVAATAPPKFDSLSNMDALGVVAAPRTRNLRSV